MTPTKLLIVDDDQKFAEALQLYLEGFGFLHRWLGDSAQTVTTMELWEPDVILLDVMMPGVDGLAVCRDIRKISGVPIIFLSARGDTIDRILGLQLGADDYLPKPFEPRELVARIESILRRGSLTKPPSQSLLQLDSATMQARLAGQNIELTATEFQALHYLYIHREKIVSRDELLTALQGMDSEVYGRAIDILISRIRQKLEDDPKNSRYIRTVRGHGYRYIGGAQ